MSNEKYHLGMIITAKDQRSFLKFRESSNDFVIKKEKLEGKDKLLEFNFFVINKKTNKGIYTHYFQSCSIRELGAIFKAYYYPLQTALKTKRFKESPSKGVIAQVERLKRSISDYFKGRLKFAIMVRDEDLKNILATLKEIKNVEVVVDAVKPSLIRPGVPLTDKARSVTQKFTIAKDWPVYDLIEDVVELSNMGPVKRGKVLGINNDDKKETVDFSKAPKNFGTFDYDELAEKLDDLHTSQFYTSAIFNDLIAVIESKANKGIF
tara:strand:+ start:208 stop:1002 length:795 start_codon:yes stop_codon:yes gene_type:complete